MNRELNIQELSIVILGRNHNPTILNPDFLKHNEIVEPGWDLQSPAICVEPMAQVHFKNQIKITAQFDKIIFSEDIAKKKEQEILIPKIANKYINTLPHVEYSAVGINLSGYIVIEGENDACYNFLIEKFITPGPWQKFGDSTVKPNIGFTYTFKDIVCTLRFEVKPIKFSDEKPIHVIMITSNFHHSLVGDNKKDRLIDLSNVLKKWEEIFILYNELVDKILVGESD